MRKKILSIVFLIVVLLSCDKPEEIKTFCWYCETSTIGGVILKFEVDSLTYEEIIIYQRGFDDGVESFIKGHVETVCIKKESP